MRKLLFILICFCSLGVSGQFVFPLTYKDYDVHYQMSIGYPGSRFTDSSAYLQLGFFTGSRRGFLLPGGYRDSVIHPKRGLLFQDLTSGLNEPIWHDGVNWRRFYYNAGTNIYFTGSGTVADPTVINADGGTTYIDAGSNVTITGAGSILDPYVVSSEYHNLYDLDGTLTGFRRVGQDGNTLEFYNNVANGSYFGVVQNQSGGGALTNLQIGGGSSPWGQIQVGDNELYIDGSFTRLLGTFSDIQSYFQSAFGAALISSNNVGNQRGDLTVSSNYFEFSMVDGSGAPIALKVILSNLPVYDTEAAAASLDQDQIYKTSTGELRIKL